MAWRRNLMKGKLFGSYFKEVRIKRRLTLRQFCEKFGFDPGNISKLERGLLPPPQSKIKWNSMPSVGSAEREVWYEFFDLAATSRGQIQKRFGRR
jgi:transcriptional regulator with XRE-family HTH domain